MIYFFTYYTTFLTFLVQNSRMYFNIFILLVELTSEGWLIKNIDQKNKWKMKNNIRCHIGKKVERLNVIFHRVGQSFWLFVTIPRIKWMTRSYGNCLGPNAIFFSDSLFSFRFFRLAGDDNKILIFRFS